MSAMEELAAAMYRIRTAVDRGGPDCRAVMVEADDLRLVLGAAERDVQAFRAGEWEADARAKVEFEMGRAEAFLQALKFLARVGE